MSLARTGEAAEGRDVKRQPGCGAAGAGKTYTMEGTREDPGINYRTMRELFRRVHPLCPCEMAIRHVCPARTPLRCCLSYCSSAARNTIHHQVACRPEACKPSQAHRMHSSQHCDSTVSSRSGPLPRRCIETSHAGRVHSL